MKSSDSMIRMVKRMLLGIVVCMAFASCSKRDMDPDRVEVSGTVYEQGITTYQYGTHGISGYALRSSSVPLNDHVGAEVTVVGYKVDGYPVDGGPEFLEVVAIE